MTLRLFLLIFAPNSLPKTVMVSQYIYKDSKTLATLLLWYSIRFRLVLAEMCTGYALPNQPSSGKQTTIAKSLLY